MDIEATGQPCEHKKKPEDTIVPGEGAKGKGSEVEFQTAYDFASPPENDNIIINSSSSPMSDPKVYILEWGLTRESLIKQHNVSYEWGHHAFFSATIEALELLSNSHMSNSL